MGLSGAVLPLLAVLSLLSISPSEGKRVLVWMCLERCKYTKAEIGQHLAQLKAHKKIVTDVSYENYNLGPHSTLQPTGLSHMTKELQAAGFNTYPMITTINITYMRELFLDPQPFIRAMVSEGVASKVNGFNLDWEPEYGPKPTEHDALQYAKFCDLASSALSAHGMSLNIAFASWSKVWDWQALGKTTLDRFLLMSTYTGNWGFWQKDASLAVKTFGGQRLGIGLEVEDPNTPGKNFTQSAMAERFAWVAKNPSIDTIAIWDAPIPDFWWGYLASFIGRRE